MDETAKFWGIFSSTKVQGELGLDILVFLNIPPETPPANTVSFVGSFGSHIMAFVRPPTLYGPL